MCSVHFTGGRKTYTIRVPSLFPLRGVNERRNRRGRGKKVSAPAPVPTPASAATATSGIVISNLSVPEGTEGTAGGEANNDEITVVQIGQNGEYLGTARLPVQTEGTCYSAPIDVDAPIDESKTETGAEVVLPAVYVSVTSSPLDHSYSLTTGTTSMELLRKLNEQRDIIALMEVKMKEMKATIRQLRVTEAKLQEELRERDRLLVGFGCTNLTVVNSTNSRKKV